MKFVAGVAVLVLTAALSAEAGADPAQGQSLAERWCASCHAIAPGEASDRPAPSFESIVNERGRSNEWIGTWLATPHQMMPDLALSREEIAALVAYFDSLRPAN
jgi:mono/diheme cytochrome c family protein